MAGLAAWLPDGVRPGGMAANRVMLEDLKADIGRMMEEQRSELCAVAAEIRSDVRQIMKKMDEQRAEVDLPATPKSEACDDLADQLERSPKREPSLPGWTSEAAAACKDPRSESMEEAIDEPGTTAPRTKSWLDRLLSVRWEWQHQDGRWEPYPQRTCQKIEKAFWRGETMVHVKAGAQAGTVMEIFFVDMLQLDPCTKRVRPVRRAGLREFPFTKHPWMWFRRHASSLACEIRTGTPQLETLEEYKKREKAELSTSELRMIKAEILDLNFIGVNVNLQDQPKQQIHQLCVLMTTNVLFLAVTTLATLLQAVYMAVALGRYRNADSQELWNRSPEIIVIECAFCLFFAVELLIRYMALSRISEGFRDMWFCFDAACVILSIFEVVIFPSLSYLDLKEVNASYAHAFRVARLGRIFRFMRLFHQVKDLRVVVRGFFIGMRSVIYIMILMSVLVFAFAYAIHNNTIDPTFHDNHFDTLFQSMRTLMFAGILMDGVGELGDAFVEKQEYGAMIMFYIFVLISYFGLFNMLIGSFCTTAMQVAQEEAYDDDLQCLSLNLRGLLECYLADGDQTISRHQFQLIMKNMHVHKTLRMCGTDIEALLMLEDVLFPADDSKLHYNSFFGVVARLRASSPACVSHVVSFTATMNHNFEEIKEMLMEGGRKARTSRTARSYDLRDLCGLSNGPPARRGAL